MDVGRGSRKVTDGSGERELFRQMLRLRLIERGIAARYAEQQMRCPVHLSIGQEGAAVGVCSVLAPEDLVFSTHRCHGHYLAKGGDLDAMVAELHGRATGCCGGRGGSMHLCDDSVGMCASVPIVGSNIPLAVGSALASQQRGEACVSVAFLGDAAAEEGVFHESLNFAATHALPVLFVLENNRYSVYTGIEQRQPAQPLIRFAHAHAMPFSQVDGSLVTAVQEAVSPAVERARHGGGPSLAVIETYRYVEHCGPSEDDELGYRPPHEVARWKARCPVELMRRRLMESGRLNADQERAWACAIEAEVDLAFVRARAAPFPDPATVLEHVYAEDRPPLREVSVG